MSEGQAIEDAVSERYGRAALQFVEGRTTCGADGDAIAAEINGRFMSAFVRTRKPGA